MKGIGALLFYLFWIVVGAAGMVMAVYGKGFWSPWLLIVSIVVYLGMFTWWGCLSSNH